ncbi:DNA alkylation repair protein [Brachybacterium vulturis]|uniref:DNA alkylation repair protein n=1 Tax=Brachybacterium vulturis TaxID=2017484 RepID=A0A291GR29_9MICO|nr:DNA alkylation repair protein [Brachybacterium vulturis]ATG52414.1 DNA alkylation repair protein [Brachybacterium vulturis]
MADSPQEPADLDATAAALREELAGLENERVREINAKRGDDHAVNLTALRGIAKRLRTQPELARVLWHGGGSAEKLLALLISRPKQYTEQELEAMLREAGTPKVQDWLVNYLVKKSPHREALREAWFADSDPVVASAGWALTSDRVVKKPEGIDQVALLDLIEVQMQDAPERLQWAMNECLAQIGITNPELRARARDIGQRLEVLKDYPTPPNCTSPFAPIWIDEMVRRGRAG